MKADGSEVRLLHEEFGDLPLGWAKGRLGDLGDYINGRGFKRSEWSDQGLPIIRIQNLTGSKDTQNYFAGDLDARHRVQSGDLLISWAATLGVYRWEGPPAALNQHIFRVVSHVDQEFHYHLVRFILAELRGATHGSGMEHITKKVFESFPVPIPPLAEQARLASRLTEIQDSVSALRARMHPASEAIGRLRRSVLSHAFSGAMTSDWRAANPDAATGSAYLDETIGAGSWSEAAARPTDLPEAWAWVQCDDLVDDARGVTYGVIKLGAAVDGGVPVLRSSNVRFLSIDSTGMKSIDPSISGQYTRTILRGGEIVVTVRGTLGGVAVVPHEMAGYNVSREVAVVPLAPGIDPTFFSYALAAPAAQRWLSNVSVGVAYTGINIRDLKRVGLAVPPLDEQREIVQRIEAAHEQVAVLEAKLDRGRALIEAVEPAALAKAFRGDLVRPEAEIAKQEGREYESGEDLLRRIGKHRHERTP